MRAVDEQMLRAYESTHCCAHRLPNDHADESTNRQSDRSTQRQPNQRADRAADSHAHGRAHPRALCRPHRRSHSHTHWRPHQHAHCCTDSSAHSRPNDGRAHGDTDRGADASANGGGMRRRHSERLRERRRLWRLSMPQVQGRSEVRVVV